MQAEAERRPAPPTKAAYQGEDYAKLARDCTRRLGELRQMRLPYETRWRDLRDYIAPARGRLSSLSPQPGDTRRATPDASRILDRTATKAAKDLAAFLQRGITSPARPWFRLVVPDQDVADEGVVRAWLDETRVRMMTVFAASNFYLAMASLYEELGIFGNGAVIIVPDYDDVIRCYPLTCGEYWIALDDRGIANTLYRELLMSAGQVVAKFGLANVSQTVRNAYENNRRDMEVRVCHAIEPNDQQDRARLGWQRLAFRSVWWEAGRETQGCLEVRGFRRFPVVAPRWDVVAGDVYGHGPGEDALPDVKSLQVMSLRRMEAVDKQVRPPLSAPAALMGTPININPAAVNFVPGASGTKLEPLFAVSPNLATLDQGIADCRAAIRAAFRADLIAMFADSDRREMTAAEVRARQEEKMLLLGPMLERFHDEALTPAIELVWGYMEDARLLPPPPQELADRYVEPDYISLLAQAQKAAETGGIERVVGFIGNLGQAFPETVDKLNADEAVDQYAAAIGASPRIVRSDAEVARIRAARAQAAAQEKAMAQMQQTADLVKQGAEGARLLSETETGAGQNALARVLGL